MNNLITQNESLTMSSTQLLSLVNSKREDFGENPVRLNQFNNRIIDELEGEHYKSFVVENPNKTTSTVYELTIDQCMLVSMRESKSVRKSVLAMLNKTSHSLPSPTQLALMVIESEKQKELAQLEVARLQGVCNTITAQFAPGVTAPKFCKQLNGVNTQQVNNALIDMGILLRHRDGHVPSSYARDRYFIERQKEHNDKLRSHSELTLVGAKWLYRAYLSNKLPMKTNWDGKFVHVVFEG